MVEVQAIYRDFRLYRTFNDDWPYFKYCLKVDPDYTTTYISHFRRLKFNSFRISLRMDIDQGDEISKLVEFFFYYKFDRSYEICRIKVRKFINGSFKTRRKIMYPTDEQLYTKVTLFNCDDEKYVVLKTSGY